MRTALVLLCCAIASEAWAVKVGDPAPDVPVPSTSGQDVKVSDFKGSWVVLYFYPASFTPGCTKEACSLRDGYAGILQLRAVVLGASLNDLETQKKFKEKYLLPFDLLADTKKKLAKAFDALSSSGLMAARKTYLISPDGKIAYIFDQVDTATHDEEVRAALERLQAPPGPKTSPAP